jgi:hypothetical protein
MRCVDIRLTASTACYFLYRKCDLEKRSYASDLEKTVRGLVEAKRNVSRFAADKNLTKQHFGFPTCTGATLMRNSVV